MKLTQKMSCNIIVLALPLLLSMLVLRVNAIKCYRCNSLDNPDCLYEPEIKNADGTKNVTKLQPFLKECNGPDRNGRQPFCRKTSFTVIKTNHHRVVRECGYERSKTNCYLADNDYHLETVCQCFTDGCNGATRFGGLGLGFVLMVVVARMFM